MATGDVVGRGAGHARPTPLGLEALVDRCLLPMDLRCGGRIPVFSKWLLVRRCDRHTRAWYKQVCVCGRWWWALCGWAIVVGIVCVGGWVVVVRVTCVGGRWWWELCGWAVVEMCRVYGLLCGWSDCICVCS